MELDAVECGILRRFASIKTSLTEVNYDSLPLAISFYFLPTPPPALPCLLTLNNPPPPGRGTNRLASVRMGRAATQSACFQSSCSLTHDVRSLLPDFSKRRSARSYSLLLASGCFSSFPLASAHLRRSAPRPAVQYERRGASPISPVSYSTPASIDMRNAGRGYRCRLLPVPPISPLLFAYASFPYFSGMVMGYSVATVMYFP